MVGLDRGGTDMVLQSLNASDARGWGDGCNDPVRKWRSGDDLLDPLTRGRQQIQIKRVLEPIVLDFRVLRAVRGYNMDVTSRQGVKIHGIYGEY